MKKLFLFLSFIGLFGIAHADPSSYGKISGFQINGSSLIVTAPGTGRYNCLTDWSLMSTSASTMTILEGSLISGTTIWGLTTAPANTPINVTTADKEEALCGGPNKPLVIIIPAGAQSINYRGFIK